MHTHQTGTPVIRRATPGDAAAIRDLTRAAYAKWVPLIGREPRPMTADYDQAVRDHWIDLLHNEGHLAALIETKPEPGHLMIVNVAVAPAEQGRGLGRVLLAHAERLAAEHALPEIRLYTNGHMAGNVALYASLGYLPNGEEQHPTLGTVIHMRKPLPAQAIAKR